MAVARGDRRRFAIVRARFNAPITQALLDGALEALVDAKIDRRDVEIVEVPGAFELPLAAAWLARSKRFAGVVALGCVIRGETPHFEYVAGAASRGLADVMLETGVPVGFGVLTTENEAQARARSGKVRRGTGAHVGASRHGNKGYEAAQAVLEMASLAARLRK